MTCSQPFCRLGRAPGVRAGLTLVEMLVAMAITLLIMAAVVTVFANVTSGVTNRRATIEMASALRNVRAVLARDLAGATCPAVTWQRPESNHGYLEIIEGPQNDYYPSPWLFSADVTTQTLNGYPIAEEDANGLITEPIGSTPGIDLAISSLPGSDLGGNPIEDIDGRGLVLGTNAALPEETPTDGRGLGDADDILMLTVRNEDEPFVGRIPKVVLDRGDIGPATPGASFGDWDGVQEVESQLAEVVWFAVENPVDPERTFAFGEPGYRTIYRRTLLILPELDYNIFVTETGIGNAGTQNSRAAAPGTVRVFPPNLSRNAVAPALAGLIAFQEFYDLSVRLEWDTNLPGANGGRWVLRANSLADLTKRENRYEHHGFVPRPDTLPLRHGTPTTGAGRYFPFAVASAGVYTDANLRVALIADRELTSTAAGGFGAVTTVSQYNDNPVGLVVAYDQGDAAGRYDARPLATVNADTDIPATARAILNENGQVVHVTTGLAPLGGNRRGDDIMMTDALAFDLRLYDPGAPLYGYVPGGVTNQPPEQIIAPGDPAWARAYELDVPNGTSLPGDGTTTFPFAGQGAYVDAGYGLSFVDPDVDAGRLVNRFTREALRNRWQDAEAAGLIRARFFGDGLIQTAVGPVIDRIAPGNIPIPKVLTLRFAAYDTWSTHYESNGLNEDGDNVTGNLRTNVAQPAMIDEGVNGLDDPSLYDGSIITRFGPDDTAERETRPPYDTALRGMQVTLRAYERDSRQIREVRVRESFVPE